MKFLSKIVLFVVLFVSFFCFKCSGFEKTLDFYKNLYTFQRLIKNLESIKPKVSNQYVKDNVGTIRLDLSERMTYVKQHNQEWEQLISNFKKFILENPNSKKIDDATFCISSAYLILSQTNSIYYDEAVLQCKNLLEKHKNITLDPTTINVLKTTYTFSWLKKVKPIESNIIITNMAKALIFAYIKNNKLSVAKIELEKMKDNILNYKDYIDIKNYLNSYENLNEVG